MARRTPFSEKKKLRLVSGGRCSQLLSREDTESSQLFRAKLLRERGLSCFELPQDSWFGRPGLSRPCRSLRCHTHSPLLGRRHLVAHTRKSMHVFLGRVNISPLPFQDYCPGTWVPRPVSHFLSLSTLNSRGTPPTHPTSGPQLLTHPHWRFLRDKDRPHRLSPSSFPPLVQGIQSFLCFFPQPLAPRLVLTLQRRQQSPSLHMASCVRVHFLQQLPPARLHS